MKKYKLQLILIWCGTHKLYESTNQPIWYTFSGSEQTRKCVAVILFLIKCCMLWYFMIPTQFYVGTYYNNCMINHLLCGETKIFKIDNYVKPCT